MVEVMVGVSHKNDAENTASEKSDMSSSMTNLRKIWRKKEREKEKVSNTELTNGQTHSNLPCNSIFW